MRFQYGDEEPTLAATLGQAIGFGSVCWTHVAGAGEFDSEAAVQCHTATLNQIKDIITLRLSKLLDADGVAVEWNSAIERAIMTIEDMR